MFARVSKRLILSCTRPAHPAGPQHISPLSSSTSRILSLHVSLFSTSSSASPTTSALVHSLPPNLRLDDTEILKIPVPKVVEPEQNFYFPPLHVATSLPVVSFHDPALRVGEAALDRRVFGVALRKDIVHEVIRYHRHKLRQPKKTKRMSEIRGSNRKPRPQKGGGVGQVGHHRNSAWRGGQKAHGPVIRDYSIQLNRKVKALGMMIVLAAKQREGNLLVVDQLQLEDHRTKNLATLLQKHDLYETSTLFLGGEVLDPNFIRASANLPLVAVSPQQDTCVYEIMKKHKVVITAEALEQIQSRLVSQYTHRGKYRAVLNSLADFTGALERKKAAAASASA